MKKMFLYFVFIVLLTIANAQSAKYYLVGFSPYDLDEEYIIKLTDPVQIAIAENELSVKPFGGGGIIVPKRHPYGKRLFGTDMQEKHGNFSYSSSADKTMWNWIFEPGEFTLVYSSPELYDGRPTLYDEYNTFGPWGSYIKSKITIGCDFTSVLAEKNESSTSLSVIWNLQNETYVTVYEIQISEDNNPANFTTIATEPKSASTSSTKSYSKFLEGAFSNANYVRIKCKSNRYGLPLYIYSDILPINEQSQILGKSNIIDNDVIFGTPFPNPANPSTSISFNLPKESFVKIKIFNSIGELVDSSEKLYSGGKHIYKWNPNSNLSSGLYFINTVIKTGVKTFSKTQKFMLLK